MYVFFKDAYFQIQVPFIEDRDLFNKQTEFLQSHYLRFNVSSKSWLVSSNKMEEILLWMDKENLEYVLQDSAKEKLQEIKNSYKRELQIYRGRVFDSSILQPHIKLFEYQKEAIEWKLKRNIYLDAYDAGTGKTLINSCVIGTLFKLGVIDGIFILTPIGLEYNFKKQILNHLNLFKEEDFFIIKNDSKIKPFETLRDKKIIISSNHLLADIILSYRKEKKDKRSKKGIRWNHHIVNISEVWNKREMAIIGDEAHEFKNPDAIRTRALNSIKDQFKYRFLLTATPNINKYEHIYSQISFLDHSIIPMSYESFKLYISDFYDKKFGIKKYNSSHVAEFNEKMKHIFTRKLKEDLPEISTKTILEEIYFSLTSIQKQLYKLIIEEELYVLQEEYDQITWKLVLSKFPLMTEVFDNPLLLKNKKFLNEEISKLLNSWTIEQDPKFIALKSKLEYYIEELNQKIILFDFHPETLNLFNEMFTKYKPVIIHGSLKVKDKSKDRSDKEDLFNYDPNCKLALLSALTSSRGGNWQFGGCNRIITYSMPFDTVQFEQLQNRTDRAVGSKKDSIIELFYYPDTLDQIRINRSLNRINLNDKMGKVISQRELDNLLRGII